MNMKSMPLFNIMQQRMGYLAERQVHLSQNIANVNTPGYQPTDLKKVDFQKFIGKEPPFSALVRTNDKHMVMGQNMPGSGRFEGGKMRSPFETTLVGNSVNLDEQMVKMNAVSQDYRTTTQTYRKMTQMLQTALGNQ